MTGHRAGRRVIGLVLAIAAAALPATPAVAGFESAGPHNGDRGLHWLLDMDLSPPEHPAVVCRYSASFKLRRLEIRPPIVYADVSGGPRTQRIGWRVIIQTADSGAGPWSTYRKLPLVKASATGKYPADLRSTAVDLPGSVDDHPYYRVNHRLTWYGPDGTTQTGSANHTPYRYGLKGPGLDSWMAVACEGLLSGATAGTPAPPLKHKDRPGPHWILDTPGLPVEFPAVTCEYDENGLLERLRIRRPIVLARNTGPGTQRQDVAWRALIQTTPQNDDTEQWYPYDATGSTRRSATEVEWADWLPKRFEIGPVKGVIGVRVVYRITWYKGTTNQRTGIAEHTPVAYLVDPHVGPSYVEDGYCYLSVLN